MGIFHIFKLYIWYQIAQSVTNIPTSPIGWRFSLIEILQIKNFFIRKLKYLSIYNMSLSIGFLCLSLMTLRFSVVSVFLGLVLPALL